MTGTEYFVVLFCVIFEKVLHRWSYSVQNAFWWHIGWCLSWHARWKNAFKDTKVTRRTDCRPLRTRICVGIRPRFDQKRSFWLARRIFALLGYWILLFMVRSTEKYHEIGIRLLHYLRVTQQNTKPWNWELLLCQKGAQNYNQLKEPIWRTSHDL